MDFIIYENFSDFKNNFRDHFAGYAKEHEKGYIFFLKDYKNRYDEACQEYDEVIECATVTSNYNAALETQEERDDRERGIYEELIPQLEFDINKNLVRALIENLKIPYSKDAPLPRIEDHGDIIHEYFCTLEAVEEFLEDKIHDEDLNVRMQRPTVEVDPIILEEAFININAQKFFYKLHEYYKDKPNQNPNYWFIYWKMVKDKILFQDCLKPMMYIRKIKRLGINIIEDRSPTESKALKGGSIGNDMRLEKYKEIKSQFPKLNNIS